ncbi:GNAT family N-acetyltransferase [Mucilaginibacter flavus]|uniref:GNAT family N-acetyltransferase n=1 Tax=Mucilaginibacter flavus TaxID=931504 RepID=UPI0025B2B67E|nr:GNAT family N-acetyltransferase [Mucilaginibacter flavus]MDN3582201.1 GNAT family N-acetyltransferase [Mucilaginibacter flavus]
MKNNIDHTIRPVQPADLDELLIMMQEHADFEKAAFGPEGKKEKLHIALFEQPQRLNCWVVEINRQLVGFASYTFDFSTWDAAEFMYMDCLFLREQTRGRGIGSEIISRLAVIAGQRNCINIQWQTPTFNTPAISFYIKNEALAADKARFTLKVG